MNINTIKNFNVSNLGAKEYFISILFALLLTDLVILLNIPFIREFLTFIYFTFVPGILILHIFKLNKLEFAKKIVLSMGISVSLLMFIGLILNSFYPLISKPLSLLPVFFSFNVIVISLLFVAYKRNNGDKINDFFNFKTNLKGKLSSPLVLAFIFPFLTILGTYLMNIHGNNILLLIMLLSVPPYILLLTYLDDKLSNLTYPIALWMISLSLLLMAGLSSNHLMGRDIHKEYYVFQLTLSNFHWDVSSFLDSFNACLDITILPTIYQVLSNINAEYVFKLFFAVIGSITPLISFNVFQKYIGKREAFFASLLIIFMAFFVASMGSVRQLVALVFFFLAVMVIFDSRINKLPKKILLLIFMVSIILSHYTTSYISFALLVPIMALPFLKSLLNRLLGAKNKINFKNLDVIIIFSVFVLIWYLLVAQVQISGGIYAIDKTSEVLTDTGITGGFTETTKDNMILAMFGIGLKSVPNMISAIVHDTVFLFIFLGLLTLLWSYKSRKPILDTRFLVGIIISLFFLILLVVIPNLSIHYPAERVFIQSLIFLAPLLVIGVTKISKIIKKPKSKFIILSILLISLFTCNTYLQYHFYGTQYSPYYENDGNLRNEYYIYDQEILGAEWLKQYKMNDVNLYSDTTATNRLLLGRYDLKYLNTLVKNERLKGYIYLRYENINKGTFYVDVDKIRNMSYYDPILIDSNIIYENGWSEIRIRNTT